MFICKDAEEERISFLSEAHSILFCIMHKAVNTQKAKPQIKCLLENLISKRLRKLFNVKLGEGGEFISEKLFSWIFLIAVSRILFSDDFICYSLGVVVWRDSSLSALLV